MFFRGEKVEMADLVMAIELQFLFLNLFPHCPSCEHCRYHVVLSIQLLLLAIVVCLLMEIIDYWYPSQPPGHPHHEHRVKQVPDQAPYIDHGLMT